MTERARRQTLAVAAITAGLVGCASDHVATTTDPLFQGTGLLTFNPDMALGQGYSTVTDAQHATCLKMVKKDPDCDKVLPKATTSGLDDNFQLDLVTSRKELQSKLGIDANLSVRYKVVEVSASVNIEKESEFTSNTITFLLKGETSYWTNVNQTDYSPELTDKARELLDEEDKPEIPSQFFVKCGDSWTTGYQRGAQFFVLLTITTSNQATRDSLEAKLKAEIGLPVVGGKVEVGVKMANAVKEANATISLKVRAHGFQWTNVAATNAVIEAALSGQIGGDTFKKFIDIHTAMQQSVNNDRCIDMGWKRAELTDNTWKCVDDGQTPGKSSHLLRLNVSQYTTVENVPKFDDTWKPFVTYQKKVDQAKQYIAQLAGLEDSLLATYYDEIKPYLPAGDITRSMYGLVPPQILPSNNPFMKLGDQDRNVSAWGDKFKPPGGSAVRRVHLAGENCWAGVTRAEFDGCTCPGKVSDLTDRCLSSLDAYRLSWNDLFMYRETGRVLPLRVTSPHRTVSYATGLQQCVDMKETMISYPEILRSALVVANTQYGQNKNTTWYQNPEAGAPAACPRSWFTAAEQARFIRPIFQNQPQNVAGGQNRAECWTDPSTTGVLCVPSGGLFALNFYGDRLQALPKPPPQVVWIDPAARTVGVDPAAKVTLVFSAALDADTVAPANVKLKDGATAIETELVYTALPQGGGTVVITPSAPLAPSKTYTVEVGTGVKGVDGDPVTAKYTSTFTVANQVKTTTPAITTGVALTAKIEAVFAAPVNAATVSGTTIKLWDGNTEVAGAVTYSATERKATFTPARPLSPSTMYKAVIDGVRDPGVLGNPVASMWWQFVTGAVVTTVDPADGATDVDRSEAPVISYSGELSEVPAAAFTLTKNGTPVAANAHVGFGNKWIWVTPAAPLDANTKYTATVTTGVLDKSGKPVLTGKTWSFTTGTTLTPRD